MLLNVRATATYDLPHETFVILMVEPLPQSRTHQVRHERLLTTRTPSCFLRHDLYGNPQRRILVDAGKFAYEFTATIETAPNGPLPSDATESAPQAIPDEIQIYTLPSRFCQSDLLASTTHREFGQLAPGGSRVQAISEWVHDHLTYQRGASGPLTSAVETLEHRAGVCRDFAHVVITFCRGLGIPARYVSAYALGLEPPISMPMPRSTSMGSGTTWTPPSTAFAPPSCRSPSVVTPPTSP